MASHEDTFSRRGLRTINFSGFLMEYGGMAIDNPYDEDSNPQGIINLGIAENSHCEDILSEKVESCFRFTRNNQYYFNYPGKCCFRKALAEFLTERFSKGEKLNPDNIIVTSGVGSAIDLCAHMFADEGDYFFVLTPFYSAIESDVYCRGGVKLHYINRPLRDTPDCKAFSFTESLLEEGWKDAVSQGKQVKGIFVINPCNPTGRLLTEDEIRTAAAFARRHDIHVFFDEIYALSHFGDGEFCSVLSLHDLPKNDKIHFMWGFSKDFAMSGMRIGVIYTWNELFLQKAGNVVYFGAVPSPLQDTIAAMISDKEWLDKVYFPTNLNRMKLSHDRAVERLKTLGIDYYHGVSGFFVFIDCSKFMVKKTKEEEFALFKRFLESKVYIIPGTELGCPEPGWFRVTFTTRPKLLEKGLDRIEMILRDWKENRLTNGC